jgi:nitroreductase
MDALEALKTRRSVRAFENREVPREVLEDLIDCARLAPSANNMQPWAFIVVTEQGMRSRIAALTDFGKFIGSAPVCVAVFCRDTKYYLEDGCAATENLLLAAHAHGLGACWVAGDKKSYAGDLQRLLDLPVDYRLVSLIALGYPAEQPTKSKRSLREVLHWERYQA